MQIDWVVGDKVAVIIVSNNSGDVLVLPFIEIMLFRVLRKG